MQESFVESIALKSAYHVPRHLAPIDLRLDGNEGPPPDEALRLYFEKVTLADVNEYPDYSPLLDVISKRHNVAPNQILITAGADDGLCRACRAFLPPQSELILPVPTFEMIPRFALAAGARIVEIPWEDEWYPVDAVAAAITSDTQMIAIVSPNNPTGGVATPAMLESLSAKAGDAVLLVDEAYGEFADDELTQTALRLPNSIVFKTLSKAWGLAGIRLGYAIGPEDAIAKMRSSGLPYPVSTPSARIATYALSERDRPAQFVSKVKDERQELRRVISDVGLTVPPSFGNFVYATGGRGEWWRDGLAGMGIGVRAWPNIPSLKNAIRITCPGDGQKMERLKHAIQTVAAPQAILFDVDGVLIDVSQSYDATIQETARIFGLEITAEDIQTVRQDGNANNDWILTQKLLAGSGRTVPLEMIKEVFEEMYQSVFRSREEMLGTRSALKDLSKKVMLGLVTGRPRRDLEFALKRFGLETIFQVTVCMEDGPPKPSPKPIELAKSMLKIERAWFIGDTVDDVRAARAASVLPIGVVAPGRRPIDERELLSRAGASRVVNTWTDIVEVLP